MGADMLVAVARMPWSVEEHLIEDMTDPRIMARVRAITLEEIEWVDAANDLGIDEELSEAKLREQVLDSIVEGWEAIALGRRDIAEVRFDDDTGYFITGGLSWGDVPTDIFDQLNWLDRTGCFDEPLPPKEAS